MAATKTKKPDIYQLITDSILAKLDEGTCPWQKPWIGGKDGMPKNLQSGKPYRGMNVFMLGWEAMEKGYKSPYWLTYKQARELGGSVIKGQKATAISFWKPLSKTETASDGTEKTSSFMMLKMYWVFNYEQTEGCRIPKGREATAEPTEPTAAENAEADKLATATLADYVYRQPGLAYSEEDSSRAYYVPSKDQIVMPNKAQFKTPEHYHATAFHEAGHSTGHKSRLARRNLMDATKFDKHAYGQEELVAEFTAAFCTNWCGVDTSSVFENTAAYLASWKKTIRADKKMVVMAAAQAQKAADLILNIEPNKE